MESMTHARRGVVMGRAKHIIVGGRGDALSMLCRARVHAALAEAHPNAAFVDDSEGRTKDDRGATGRKLVARRAATVLHRLEKGEIDVAVMDACMIPLQLAGTLEIAAVFARTNPFDAFVSFESLILDEQPENASVAVGDPVKRGQLLYYRSDLKLVNGDDDFGGLFEAMSRGTVDAFVYPASDVEMLNQQEHVVEVFTTSICTPVAGQGALALVGRRDKKEIGSMLRDIGDRSAAAEIEIERMFLERVAKDGRAPVGVLANVDEHQFEIEAAIVAVDGSEKITGIMSGALSDRSRIVDKLAGELLASGGEEIVATFRKPRGNG
jgi:hydroxymethylbilane synthase